MHARWGGARVEELAFESLKLQIFRGANRPQAGEAQSPSAEQALFGILMHGLVMFLQ